MYKIPERDWKVVRKLHPVMLQRYCQQVFQKVEALTPKGDACDFHKAYLELRSLLKIGDKQMRELFNDLSRSNAIMMVMTWMSHELITDDELAMLSEETVAVVDFRE